MEVKTVSGTSVNIVRSDGKSLFDANNVEWARNPNLDDRDHAAYTETRNHITTIMLGRYELRRVCAGDKAIRTPTTVQEMRYHAVGLHKSLQEVIDGWPNQRLREILVEADEKGVNAGTLLEKTAEKEVEDNKPPKRAPEATERPTEAHKESPRYSRPSRPRKQEGSVSVALGEAFVLLTPKQLEFMERLSECPEWDGTPTGEYNASLYAQELEDTMNPMSVGAVLTTLREKNLLQTKKRKVGGVKCCIFKLTDLGEKVYRKLAGGK